MAIVGVRRGKVQSCKGSKRQRFWKQFTEIYRLKLISEHGKLYLLCIFHILKPIFILISS